MNQTTFSIITVVYNGEEFIEGTLQSVLKQRYPKIEYIIIDGGSKDRTMEIVKQYAVIMPSIKWISERDKGLYDAMNKGLKMATGDFVWFLNGGDHLHSPDTVAALAEKVAENTDVLYGETLLVDVLRTPVGTMSELSTRKLPETLSWRDYTGGMLVVHQSFVARRSISLPYIGDNLCADYDWCIEILKKSRSTVNSELILTNYLMGGVSKQRHRQSLKDRFSIMRKHFGLLSTIVAHIQIVFRAVWHKLRRLGKTTY